MDWQKEWMSSEINEYWMENNQYNWENHGIYHGENVFKKVLRM